MLETIENICFIFNQIETGFIKAVKLLFCFKKTKIPVAELLHYQLRNLICDTYELTSTLCVS